MFHSVLIVFLLTVVAIAAWRVWVARQRQQARRLTPPRSTQWAEFSDTSPLDTRAMALRASHRAVRRVQRAEAARQGDVVPAAAGSDTAPAPFVPEGSMGALPAGPAGSEAPSGSRSTPEALDSWFSDAEDTGSSTQPDWLRADVGGLDSAPGPGLPPAMQRALRELEHGPVDQAWEALRGHLPPAGLKQATLEICDRIAAGFEADARFEQARDVYEHMADIDPDWPGVRERLARVRGLSQVDTVRAWGSVPPRPVPVNLPAHLTQLGRYVIDKPLGHGAMGAVYLAHDPRSGQVLALKTLALAREFSGDALAEVRSRFLREADMAGRLHHPDIVSIIESGECDGLGYIAMEHVDGVDLGRHAQPDTLLPVVQVLQIGARVARALAHAHSRGVTHRDIKPENIMVNASTGLVKVMDFGVARVADATRTRTGVVLGTPTYMSPEQLAGQNVDGRTDLYALGVTLFQLLTGRLPYAADGMGALMRAIARETPPSVCDFRPELPPALGDVIALALQKHPATRYATGTQMAEDLQTLAQALSAAPASGLPAATA